MMSSGSETSDWSRIPAALASDVSGRSGAMSGAIRALSGDRLVGRAHTLRVVAGDNRSIHFALATTEPGSVLVVDAGGYADRAVWGGVLTEAAMLRGIAGLVLDGAIRDLAEIRERGFPVFARGTSPAGPHKSGGGTARGIVSCGGVAVAQGDLIVADLDGVTVVPQARISATLDAAKKRHSLERSWVDRIRAGEDSAAVLGLGPEQVGE